MFCATFYSYKGGVGRTLALANVAAVLAQKGRRVLVVDFDLEAPGLTTLPPFADAANRPGIVDFVSEYVDTGAAPDARRFIHTCEVVHDEPYGDIGSHLPLGFTIDVMPAGMDGDGDYAGRLSRIDWNELYAQRDGFLLMENLRAAWQDAGYDYVLIDSRTGHTDVGGICTRQLPNAVAAVFFPNEQNLVGLRQVVEAVRMGGGRPQPIELTFVASRVPRLDDEHGHLKRWLDRFQAELGYPDEQLNLVEHYDSLMLLNQALFVLDRPRTGLSQQYRDLAASIARLNPEDADGALEYLTSIAATRSALRFGGTEVAERWDADRLDMIGRTHANDAVVQFALARAHYRVRNLLKAVDACALAIVAEGRTKTSRPVSATLPLSTRQLRLKALSELGRGGEALEDARAILADENASSTMLVDAVLALASGQPEELKDPMRLQALAAASPQTLLRLAQQLSELPSMAETAARLAEEALRERSGGAEAVRADPTEVQLVLIAGGRFKAAVRAAELALAREADIHVTFNTAMATWGCDGAPDLEQFRAASRLFAQSDDRDEPNWQQCCALTHAVLGEIEAMEEAAAKAIQLMKPSRRREFSCWTYSQVSKRQFDEHVAAIVRFGKGEGSGPEVFERAKGGERRRANEAPTP